MPSLSCLGKLGFKKKLPENRERPKQLIAPCRWHRFKKNLLVAPAATVQPNPRENSHEALRILLFAAIAFLDLA